MLTSSLLRVAVPTACPACGHDSRPGVARALAEGLLHRSGGCRARLEAAIWFDDDAECGCTCTFHTRRS